MGRMRLPTLGDVSEIMVIPVRRGKDGRDYPVIMPPPVEWRWEVVSLLHNLVHVRGMTHRQAQAELLAQGYRRSTGSIAGDLTRKMPTCPVCRAAGDHE